MKNRTWIIIDTRSHSALYGLCRKTLTFATRERAREVASQFFESSDDYIIYNTDDIGGMFSEEQMEQAFNDGIEAERQRCGEFNIENYC